MKYILTVLSILMILSCTDNNFIIKNINGVRVVNNKNVPNAPDMELKLNKLYEISTDSITHTCNINMEIFDFDSRGNFYILDFIECRVFKYNNKGKYLKSFCRQGSGPGEAGFVGFMTIKNDTIMIYESNRGEFVCFDTEGNFLENRKVDGKKIDYIKYNDNFTASVRWEWVKEGGTKRFNRALLMDNFKRNSVDTIYNFTCKGEEEFDSFKKNFSYLITDDKIYFPKPDENIFNVTVYDENGAFLKIFKNHKKLEPSKNYMNSASRYPKLRGFKPIYKNLPAVNKIYEDKYRNIWCMTMDSFRKDSEYSNNTVFDVFSPEGIYLNRIIRDKRWFNPFIDDKYIEYDEENRKIIVNNYEIK